MSKSANKTAIGAFVTGAIALLVVAIAVFGSGEFLKEKTRYVLFFDSSIKGLSMGSSVMFRGVPVGRVVEIRLTGDLRNMSFNTPVFIEIDGESEKSFFGNREGGTTREYMDKLVAHGLRGNLATQSLLTGQLMIELNFYAPNELPQLFDKANLYDGVQEIPTVPSTLDSLMQRAAKLPYEQIMTNLLDISEEIENLLKSVNQFGLAERTGTLLGDVDALIENMNNTLAELRGLIGPYADLAANTEKKVDVTLEEAARLLKAVSVVADETTTTMREARAVLNQNSPTVLELNRAIREISDTARSVRMLTNTLERHPESLLRGK